MEWLIAYAVLALLTSLIYFRYSEHRSLWLPLLISTVWPLFWLLVALGCYRRYRAQRALKAVLRALYRARCTPTARFDA